MPRSSPPCEFDQVHPYVPGSDSDERFRAALDASLDAMYLCESVRDASGDVADFRLVEVNTRGVTLFGVERDAMVGRTMRELLPNVDAGGFLQRCTRVVETGRSFEETLDLRGRGRPVEWVHHQVVRVGDGLLVTSRDISLQKRAEEATRRSEERHREIVERASDGIYRIDPQGVFTFANPVVSRILGIGTRTVVGRHYLDFVRHDFHEQGLALYTRQIRELIPVTYWEFPAVTPEGREVWIGQKVQVETDGRWVTGLFAVARDITERKRAELALRESEARYRFLAEQSADLLSRHAPDGTIRYASRAAHAILGVTPEELTGLGFEALAHPDDVALLRAAHARVVGHFGLETVTFRARRRDGTYAWLETTSHAVRDPDRGAVGEMLMMSRDVTARQDREARLRRTEVLDAVARISGDIAEELDGVVEALQAAGDATREVLAAPEAAKTLSRHVDALGLLARRLRAAGRRECLAPTLLDVNGIVRGLEPVIVRLCGEAVTVRLALDPWVPPAFADAAHVEAAVMELVRNSCAAMPDGGTLHVETFARGGLATIGSDRGVVIRIRDTGDGVPADVRRRLYEPFPDGAARRGTGLGIAAVHGVLAQGGGTLTVEPAPGGGTLATIALPDR